MKYGIKAILRAPLKTALFFLLIAAVTAVLSLGVGIWRGAEGMLDEADEIFKTAGEFVYTGGNYPDGAVHDESLQRAAAAFDRSLLARPEVKLAENNLLMRAYIEDYAPRQADMPYGRAAVLIVTANYPMDMLNMPDVFNVFSEAVLYTPASRMGMAMLMYTPEGMTLRKGQSYAVIGRLVTVKGHNYTGLQVISPEDLGYPGVTFPFITEVDSVSLDDPFWDSETGLFYKDVAEKLRVVNSSADVIATHDITAVSEFHRGEYTLKSGAFFTEEQQRSGAYCLIPDRVARRYHLSAGDPVELSVLPRTSGAGRFAGFEPSGGFAEPSAYTVAGVYDAEDYTTPIFIPAAGQPWLYHSDADYILARVVLHSRHAASFLAALEGNLPDGVRFDHSDQGYAAAVRSVNSVRATALMITGVCIPACLLVLWFFGFFFVFRSRETARILLILGTRAGGIVRFFLAGSGAITLVAAAAGTVGGSLIMERIFHTLFAAAEAATGRDARFSISGLGIKSDDFTPVLGETSLLWPVLTAVAVILAALIVCLSFAALLIRSQNPRVLFRRREKRGHKHDRGHAPKRPAGARLSAALPTVTLRYGVRSILRGKQRSLTVPALFAALLLFLALFASVKNGYRERLATVYDDVPVTLRVTDISGRKLDNLVFFDQDVTLIEETGFTQSVFHSVNFRVQKPPGRAAVGNWKEDAVWSQQIWGMDMSEFQLETFENQMKETTDALFTVNGVGRAPEFFYSGLPEAIFADGLDWDYFDAAGDSDAADYEEMAEPQKHNYILISKPYAEEYGLSPDDDVLLTVYAANRSEWTASFRVGGVYDAGNTRKTVYCFDRRIAVAAPYEYLKTNTVGFNSRAYLSEDSLWVMVTDHVSGEPIPYIYIPEGDDPEDHLHEIKTYLENWTKYDSKWSWDEYSYSHTFNAGGAMLQNTEDLSTLKDWLSERYDQLGKAGVNRRWVIIDDDALYTAAENLTRYIGYMDMLYPVIFALVAAMGFLISNLLLKSRAAEIGILRGVGTPRNGVFFALFVEQILLSLPGLLAGIFIPPLIFAGIGTAAIQNAGLFSACYFTGAAIAILHTFRDKAIKNLARKEE